MPSGYFLLLQGKNKRKLRVHSSKEIASQKIAKTPVGAEDAIQW